MTYTPTSIKFLRLHEVMARTGLSRSQIYKLISEGQFPAQVKLGCRSVAWIEADVIGWMHGRVARAA
ncbi:helix-turn-helix transcriptional regulator [Dyella sedimenti]|uniref:helix-turn-helix transcriptional regulator n=1 Tax=Dyella sedimenti TaxID=2919947 RepID=UPI00242FB75C|nr:AlpA family transcriptional regulator [Dyella sedimenti]